MVVCLIDSNCNVVPVIYIDDIELKIGVVVIVLPGKSYRFKIAL